MNLCFLCCHKLSYNLHTGKWYTTETLYNNPCELGEHIPAQLVPAILRQLVEVIHEG